jgi:hypothetical protein
MNEQPAIRTIVRGERGTRGGLLSGCSRAALWRHCEAQVNGASPPAGRVPTSGVLAPKEPGRPNLRLEPGVVRLPASTWTHTHGSAASSITGGERRQPARSDNSPGRNPGIGANAAEAPHRPPQSEPVIQTSRLVAQIAPSVAFGLGLRILAAGPANSRHYSY